MISFKCNQTKDLFEGKVSSEFRAFAKVALRKLDMLNSAISLQDLKSPPNNRLEALKGNRKGQYSIRINQQWRICFEWNKRGVCNVEIVDYH